jgi:tetratricopeptide (TPR) repeat protein
VTNDNAPSVAEICVRLDGLPLAIELAAARVRLFPPQALLSRLSSSLKVLTGGAVNLPARQQTMRAAIEWSYELLEAKEKQLFRRMAVFQGGCTLEGLEAVCNSEGLQVDGQLQIDVVEGIESLINQSLLQQREGRGRGDGEPRFWMLETIHEYAREKLGESGEAEALQREHALYFMQLAEEAEPHLTGGKQAEWLHKLEEEHDNIRAALRWARGEDGGRGSGVEVGLRIAGAMSRFWYVRGYLSEGREQLAQMLQVGQGSGSPADSGPQPPTPDPSFRAKALNGVGNLAYSQADYAAARSLYEESLAIRRELGDKRGIAISLSNLGRVAYSQGDYPAARSLHEESLAIRRELGDKWGIAYSLNSMGSVAYLQGDYAAAHSLYEESLTIRRELQDKRGCAECLAGLGGVAARMGQWQAQTRAEGQAERGTRLLGAAEALLGAISAVLDPEDRMVYEQGVASARAQLSEEDFERAWAEGRAMSMEAAIEYALEYRSE